jgi:hypothetical protein
MIKTCISLLFICLLIGLTQGSELKIKLENNFLNLPVTYDEEDKTTIEILIDGKSEIFFDIYLADQKPDFWVFVDVTAFKGKTAVLKADRDDKSGALKKINRCTQSRSG